MKAVIYARQSGGKDDVSESVEAQIANCQKLAAKEKIEVVGVFRDLNTSGETYPVGAEDIARVDSAYKTWVAAQSGKKAFRMGLGRALQLLSGVNYIIVNELTRMYRPINGSFLEGHINNLLQENNVKVLQVQGGLIDLAQFDQQLVTAITNRILYNDLQKKRLNSINAFRTKRDRGKYCCGIRTFGFNYLGNDRIEVKPECIEVIKYVFDSICSYKSYTSIVKYCNEHWGNLCFFYTSSIYSMVKRPIYAGYQYNTAGELIKNVQMTGQEVITFEQWQKANEIISTKRRESYRGGKKHWLPLSGKLYCGACGSKLVCNINHGKIGYICNKPNIDLNHEKCKNSRIRFETGAKDKPSLYDAVFPLLSIALIERHRKAVEILKNREDVSKFEVELENLNIKEEQLSQMFLDNLIAEDQLRRMLAGHKKKRSELLRKITEANTSDISSEELDELENNLLSNMFSALAAKSLEPEIYESLLNEAMITATVFRDRVDFQTKYGTVTIPRVQIKTRFWMPAWKIELKTSGKEKLVKIDENTKIIVTYITGEKSILADMGALKIQSR